jgi:AbrB family looped-hinge helix DNA binding protein
MFHTAKITSKGQITLPSQLRKTLGLKPGDRIVFVEDRNGDFRMEARRHGLADLRGIVKAKGPITKGQIDHWIEEARAARYGSDRG